MRVGICQINTIVGDLEGNVERCLAAIHAASKENPDLVILPEMAVPGYPPRDILYDLSFIQAVSAANLDLARRLSGGPPAVVGTISQAGTKPPGHPGLFNVSCSSTTAQYSRSLPNDCCPFTTYSMNLAGFCRDHLRNQSTSLTCRLAS
jgi:NAD+ synthase (glutamine-hydrolysing)